jgi:hypothetical protein
VAPIDTLNHAETAFKRIGRPPKAAALDEKPNAESKRIFATVHELLGSSVEMPPLGAHARDRVMP